MRIGKKVSRQPHRQGVSVVNPDGHVIGLDIGATRIRVVMLAAEREPGKPVISHGVAEYELPSNAIVDSELVDAAALTRSLKEIWRVNDFGCRHVVVGISHAQVVVRPIQMPKLPDDQLAKALPFQARDIIALPVEEALLDYHVLGDSHDKEGTVDGLLVAAPRQHVINVVRAVEAAGLPVARVDLASFGALRAVATYGSESEAVIDLGAQTTNIVIHHRGIPRVVRSLPRGGQQLTARLADRSGVGLVEAELMKREIGLTGPNPEVVYILRDAVKPLFAEIRGSIQYFSTTNGLVAPERIILTGGGAELPGLVGILADDTGLDVTSVDPHQYVERSANRHNKESGDARASAVAVGLAIGAAA